MKAFVTGITGFAGSHLAAHLLACGDEVGGGSFSGEWPADVAPTLREQVPTFRWDLAEGLTNASRQPVVDFAPDVIYHLGAISIPDDCGREWPTPNAIATNVIGTMAVLELAYSLPRRPRVLFTSSAHVYSPVTVEKPFVKETSPVGPTNGYGKSKWSAEELARRFYRDQQGDVVIARVFKHAGPGQSPRMMLAQWSQQLVRDTTEPVQVYSLDSFLDLSDVRDIVRAYRLLAEHGKSGETYNIGSGINHRSGDIFAEMQRLAGSSRPIVETKPVHRQEPIADIAKIVATTGWRPEISLEQTVHDVLDYWRQH